MDTVSAPKADMSGIGRRHNLVLVVDEAESLENEVRTSSCVFVADDAQRLPGELHLKFVEE